MPTTFSRSMRSLNADNSRRSIASLLLVATLSGVGLAWCLFAQITLYEVTETGRVETTQEVHPVDASIAGQVAATYLVLGQEVAVGDVLVEFDAETERLALDESLRRLTSLSNQRERIDEERHAEVGLHREQQRAGMVAIDEARAKYREAIAAAEFAEAEVARLARLHATDHPDEAIIRQAQTEAEKRRAAADALELAVKKLEWEQQEVSLALDEARAKYREMETGAQLAVEESERLTRLYEGGAVTQVEHRRAQTEAQQRQAVVDAYRAQIDLLEWKREGAPLSLNEARAQHREAEAIARFAEAEVLRLTRLHEGGHLAEVTFRQASAEAKQRQAAADALRMSIATLEAEQKVQEKVHQLRLTQLKREVDRLSGEIDTAEATIKRLTHEIDKRRIRAAVAGKIGEVSNRRVGEFVDQGEKLAVIVPPGQLRVITHFDASSALGRLRPGQPARIRLDAYPWTQYGEVKATVARAASEPIRGQIRVEMTIDSDDTSPIPLEHGLPGSVEVEVERVSPAVLVLRAAGKMLRPRQGVGNGARERGSGS